MTLTTQDLMSRLQGDGRGGKYLCPAHEDRNPSLHVKEGTNGPVIHCFAGCEPLAVLEALGLTWKDFHSTPEASTGLEALVYYTYKNEKGDPLYRKVRRAGKRFHLEHLANGKWIPGRGPAPSVPYRLPELTDAIERQSMIFFVEGEKDCERLASLGFCATTSGAASSWESGLARHFVDALVVMIPDNDPAGYNYAYQVASDLVGVVSELALLKLPGLPDKGDVSDYLLGHTLDDLNCLFESDEYLRVLDSKDAISRELTWKDPAEVLETPGINFAELLSDNAPRREMLFDPIIPSGSDVVLYAAPKQGKSLFVLEVAITVALGEERMGQLPRGPQVVIYVDHENSLGDIRERLEDFGFSSSDSRLDVLQSHLIYLHFPPAPPLDSEKGGQWAKELVERHNPVLFIIDTVARAVEGEENSADTYRLFHRHALRELKARGVAVIRIDHSGKDVEKGIRGTSDKAGSADLVYLLVADGPRVSLRSKAKRIPWVADEVNYTKLFSPLRHVADTRPHSAAGIELAKILDRLDLPLDASRRTVIDSLKAAGFTSKRGVVIDEAQKIRRQEANRLGRSAFVNSANSDRDKPPDKPSVGLWDKEADKGGQGFSDETKRSSEQGESIRTRNGTNSDKLPPQIGTKSPPLRGDLSQAHQSVALGVSNDS